MTDDGAAERETKAEGKLWQDKNNGGRWQTEMTLNLQMSDTMNTLPCGH